MSTLAAAALGAGLGLGALLVLAGLTGRPMLAGVRMGPAAERLASGRGVARATGAAALGLVVVAVTGWLAAGLLAAAGVLLGPRVVGGKAARESAVARTEAIAAWTELVRDSIAAASGLEEAIVATVPVAPEPIRREVRLLVERLQRRGLPDALAAFGEDLNHPSADFVVVALSIAARMEASDLSELLSRLADSIRGEARMRTRVEVGRAKVRAATKIILGVVAASVGLLTLLNRSYLAVYDPASGQLVLLVVGTIFGFGGWLLVRMSAIEAPERFRARPTGGVPR